MARRRQVWSVVAGGLAGMASWLNTAAAQAPPSIPTPGPTGLPVMGQPGGPGPASNPLSMSTEGPTAFSEELTFPERVPYFLKFKAEYVLGYLGNPSLSSPVATSSTITNRINNFGAFGQTGTVNLLGSGSYDYQELMGGRFTGGVALGWFPVIEVSGNWMQRPTFSLLSVQSNGAANTPVLARPFQAVNQPTPNGQGLETVLQVAFPGVRAGSINVDASASTWGVETNFLVNVGSTDTLGLDCYIGYRYLGMNENLAITSTTTPITGFVNFSGINLAGGFTTVVSDTFKSHNDFNGVTFGARPVAYVGQFSLSLDTKLSLGCTRQELDVNGQSTLISPDSAVRGTQSVPGGLLAVQGNIGEFTRNVFTVIPELDINVGVNLTRTVRLFGTYNIFYWSSVVRPGESINSRIDSRLIPTDPSFNPVANRTQPSPQFFSRDFWGQAFTLGVEIGF